MCNRKGFTLLELLVVISVLVIMIGMAIPTFKGMQQQGTLTQVQKELQTLQGAVESYYTNSNPNAYPPSTTLLISNYLISAIPQIIGDVFYDPLKTSPQAEYRYIASANRKYYLIRSVGLDGVQGGLSISNTGVVLKIGDDICVTNGSGC